MASNESMAGGKCKGVNKKDNFRTLTQEEYAVLKAKAELYDEYVKQSRFYNKYGYKKDHEDDGK